MSCRRTFIRTAGAGALLCATSLLRADDYPSRPIRLVVPFPPGGALDTYVRVVQQELERQLGQPVVPENLPGAGGMIGAAAVARAKPDGYTVMAGPIQTLSINTAVHPKMSYDPLTDFAAVVQTVMVNYILAVNPKVPAKSVAELIAHAKANPGKVTYATSGSGSAQHMAVALLQAKAGLDLLHVPYKGMGPAINDLLGGQVDMTIADEASLVPHVKTGKLRALAVAGARRSAQLPDLPTIAQAAKLPDYDAVAWQGIVVPAATPAPIVQRLNDAFNRAQTTPAISERLKTMGFELVGGSADAFRQFLAADVAKWKQVAKENNIKAD
ncbi:MAG: Bug family tripartite tricarboxylate transporter substrate binding protein [Lautropia sp.]